MSCLCPPKVDCCNPNPQRDSLAVEEEKGLVGVILCGALETGAGPM